MRTYHHSALVDATQDCSLDKKTARQKLESENTTQRRSMIETSFCLVTIADSFRIDRKQTSQQKTYHLYEQGSFLPEHKMSSEKASQVLLNPGC